MKRHYPIVRRPVRRPGAEQSLLIMLLSFALSVSLTRLFLELTGYPQLGGGGLHIAHMLWGGLLLFAAALLPLIFANRWVYLLSAALSGVGIGLFIDEVGKFITQNNDYFYPAAAPIIYAFFLICVVLYLQMSRPSRQDARAEMYTIMELMEEVLDHDLDARERAEIESRLRYVIEQNDQPELSRLGQSLLEYCMQDNLYIAPASPEYLKKAGAKLLNLEQRHVSRSRFRTLLALGLGILGLASLIDPIRLISIYVQPRFLAGAFALPGLENGQSFSYWFFQLQLLQGIVGILLVVGAALLVTDREQQGIRFSYLALLVYLTMVNLLLFYYNQFSTIISALIQFALLMAVMYYRQRYIEV